MKGVVRLLFGTGLILGALLSQVAGQDSSQVAKNKLRVLITEGDSWKEDGSHPKTEEIVKAFNQKCPELTATADFRKQADYFVRLDSPGDRETLPERTKFVALDQEGRVFYTSSKKPTSGDAIKSVCSAIQKAAKHDDEDESPSKGITLDDMEH